MLSELPFYNLSDNLLEKYLKSDDIKNKFYDRLADAGLRDYLFALSKDEQFKTPDSK